MQLVAEVGADAAGLEIARKGASMKTLATTFAVAVATIGAATSASAADLGGMKDGPRYDPGPGYYRPFSWTGFYVGVQTGYVWGNADHGFADTALPGSSDPNGWIGGGHAGYNWQSGRFVFGVEGDIEGGDVGGSFTRAGSSYGAVDMSWQGSLRARAGIASDRTLFYMTAGWAFADADFTGQSFATAGACCGYSKSIDGWTLGAGIEYAVTNNVTLRGEYRYTDFGTVKGNIGSGVSMPVDFDSHALRLGASFKF